MELEVVGYQIVDSEFRLPRPGGFVFPRSGKDVVQLVRQHPCHGVREDPLVISRPAGPHLRLQQSPDAVAIDFDIRLNHPVADMGLPQRAFTKRSVRAAAEATRPANTDHRQIRPNFSARVAGSSSANFEAEGRKNRPNFIFKCRAERLADRMLVLHVHSDGSLGKFLGAAECRQTHQSQAADDELHTAAAGPPTSVPSE